MVTGFKAALDAGADVVVKIDGDGQMDPALLLSIAAPVLSGRADYSKGNRFFNPRDVTGMPPLRLFGNSALSFITKLSSGYYGIVDPTNGYLAISRRALELLELDRLEKRYFFESDMLFRLNLVSAVVEDVPMRAVYGDEKSSLKVSSIIFPFARKHLANFAKRIFYNYILRDFNYGSMNLLAGIAFALFGLAFGINHWVESITEGQPATAGTVMLAALPLLISFQLISNFFTYDMHHCPTIPLSSRSLPKPKREQPLHTTF